MGWPSAPLRDVDVQLILRSLLREADRRWHAEAWSSYRGARVLDAMYAAILAVPTPRRILEALASIGLRHLAEIHGIVRADDP